MRRSADTHAIGFVAEVDSERLRVELDPATSGFVKAGLGGVFAVGSINSYLAIESGPTRIIAVITGVRMFEARERDTDSAYDPSLSVTRQVEAVMVGRIEAGRFHAGLTVYPPLFAQVSLATAREVSLVFAPPTGPSLRLGESVVAPDQDVVLDANLLLGHHCAVVGSTGSGKSCTVTAILDGLLEHEIPRASVIVFDTNGEYARAFRNGAKRAEDASAIVIGPNPGPEDGLVIPHWFMDNEDHIELLRASPGAQIPILQRSVVDARLAAGSNTDLQIQLGIVSQHLDAIQSLSVSTQSRKPQEALIAPLESLHTFLSAKARDAEAGTDEGELWERMATSAAAWANLGLDADAWDTPIDPGQRLTLTNLIEDLRQRLQEGLNLLGLGHRTAASNFDAPRYYSLDALYEMYMPSRIRLESAMEPRIEQYCATLLMRLATLLADERYDFFTRVAQHDRPLGRFLRLMLGFNPEELHDGENPAPWQGAYEAQASGDFRHTFTIIDLSLVASDVLETMTALLARLLLDFAQRIEPRASFPMLLVLEEAHRYIPAAADIRSRSTVAFERIAKEGRKYGVSLLMSTQRPSELSRTVLAQMGTVIAHRMTNPLDQDLMRHATSVAGRDVLRQLPGLSTQHALVIGEAVAAPVHVRIRDVLDPPESQDPDFITTWAAVTGDEGDRIDRAAADWEVGRPGRTGRADNRADSEEE